MATIENNEAAWLPDAKVKPLKVGSGPDQTKPEANEVIIQVAAVAINPSEGMVSKGLTRHVPENP
jgi:NADPH:quinone reductase-like Zn-dependent oxidoreductase